MEQVYNRIRTAWDSGVPSALDRIAEQLAEEGIAESVILSETTRLLLEVRAAGADDETEDQITDVMDRLVGWCHESWHIKTKRIDSREPTNGDVSSRRDSQGPQPRASDDPPSPTG